MVLCISVVSVVNYLSFLILFWGSFLMSLAKSLSIWFVFKEPALSFIDHFYSFLVFIYFCSDHYFFLLSTNFDFCLFFS